MCCHLCCWCQFRTDEWLCCCAGSAARYAGNAVVGTGECSYEFCDAAVSMCMLNQLLDNVTAYCGAQHVYVGSVTG